VKIKTADEGYPDSDYTDYVFGLVGHVLTDIGYHIFKIETTIKK
jgi:hypothetical protein